MKLFAAAILAQSSVAIRMQSKALQEVSDDYRNQAFDVDAYDACIASGESKTNEMREKCTMIRQCREGCDEQFRLTWNPDWLIYDTCNSYCETGAESHPAYGWCQSRGDDYLENKKQRCKTHDQVKEWSFGSSFMEMKETDPEGWNSWCHKSIEEDNI